MASKIPTIKVTHDYDQFIIIKENREVVPSHLKKLAASIERKNFLHLFPIIVNDRLEVIEGQHRLRSAQQLNYPIYYIIDNDISATDIAMVNSNRKSWSAKDYIRFYAEQGNASYQHLHKLLQKYPKITVTTAIRLSNQNKGDYFGGGGETQQMREGKVECINSAMAAKIADTCATIHVSRYYAFDPVFMLHIKKCILNSTNTPTVCCNTLLSKKHMLPKVMDKLESCLPLLKEIIR